MPPLAAPRSFLASPSSIKRFLAWRLGHSPLLARSLPTSSVRNGLPLDTLLRAIVASISPVGTPFGLGWQPVSVKSFYSAEPCNPCSASGPLPGYLYSPTSERIVFL